MFLAIRNCQKAPLNILNGKVTHVMEEVEKELSNGRKKKRRRQETKSSQFAYYSGRATKKTKPKTTAVRMRLHNKEELNRTLWTSRIGVEKGKEKH